MKKVCSLLVLLVLCGCGEESYSQKISRHGIVVKSCANGAHVIKYEGRYFITYYGWREVTGPEVC